MSELERNHLCEAKAGGEEGITDHRNKYDGCGIRSTNDVGNMNMISPEHGVGFACRKQELEVSSYSYQGVVQDNLPKIPKVWIVTNSYLAQV